MKQESYLTTFDDLLAQRLGTLAAFVEELEQSITVREVLSRQHARWLEEQYAATKQKLLGLEAWPFPSNPGIETRRQLLERSLESILVEQRQEEVSCWRDTELLQKELRNWKKQHHDLRQRLALLQETSY